MVQQVFSPRTAAQKLFFLKKNPKTGRCDKFQNLCDIFDNTAPGAARTFVASFHTNFFLKMKTIKVIGCAFGLLLLMGVSANRNPITGNARTSIIKEAKLQWQQFSSSLSGGLMQPHRSHFSN